MEQENRDIAALYEISKVLSLSSDINKALTSVLNILRFFLGMQSGTVSLFDPVTGDLFIEAAPEMTDAERIRGRYRPGEGITGRIFHTGVPMAIPDAGSEPLFLNRTGARRDLKEGPTAFLGVPIRDGRITLGVLTIDRPLSGGPFSFDRDLRLLTLAANMIAARIRFQYLESPLQRVTSEEAPPVAPGPLHFPGVVGSSGRMHEVVEMVARVAPSRATVLLRGESGTGKELVAKAIHENSPRASRPFVVLSCAAIPETLLESELFGHEKGAFTGATQTKKGRFELADGGTLFLDEIGETPMSAQVKLLRVLQERQFERVGGGQTITVDIRLIAATNRDLEEAVREGKFRLDLYHRLSVVGLLLPPLRERREDIPLLADNFLKQLNSENNKQLALSHEAIEVLQACNWSGNVRQLRNCLERVVVTTKHPRILPEDVSCHSPAFCFSCLLEQVHVPEHESRSSLSPAPAAPDPPLSVPLGHNGDERDQILQALEKSGWVQAKAARLLGMTARQLNYRVRKYEITLKRL